MHLRNYLDRYISIFILDNNFDFHFQYFDNGWTCYQGPRSVLFSKVFHIRPKWNIWKQESHWIKYGTPNINVLFTFHQMRSFYHKKECWHIESVDHQVWRLVFANFLWYFLRFSGIVSQRWEETYMSVPLGSFRWRLMAKFAFVEVCSRKEL